MIVTVEGAGRIARFTLSVEGNGELKRSIGNVNDGFGKRGVKLQLNESAVTKLYSELVTGLVLAIIALVYLVAKGAELNVAVCSYKL